MRFFRFGQGNLLDCPTSLLNGPRLFAIGQGLFGLSLEFTDNLFGFDAETAFKVDGITAAGIDDILPLGRDLVLFPTQVVFQFPGFLQAIRQFYLFFIQLLSLGIELGQDFFHIHVLGLAAQFLGLFENRFRHAKPFADAEGMRAAGRADAQFIRRLQGFRIEFDVAVFNTRRIIGVVFQIIVMGRDHDIGFLLIEGVQDGDGNGTAFCRIGPGTQFVGQDEVVRAAVLQDIDQLLHMAGKGTQVLRDILFVTDIGKDVAEDGQFRRFLNRDKKSCLMHEDQKAQGLHGYGLTTGIGTGNEENPVVAAEDDGIRHDVFGIDEGMAGPDELDLPRLGNGRTAGLHLPS